MKIIRLAEIRESETAALFIGCEHGAGVSFFITSHRRGEGPDAHRHPYEETFVVQEGATEVTVDGATVEVQAGTVVVVPAGAVHSFKATSDGITRTGQHPPGGRDGDRVERMTSSGSCRSTRTRTRRSLSFGKVWVVAPSRIKGAIGRGGTGLQLRI